MNTKLNSYIDRIRNLKKYTNQQIINLQDELYSYLETLSEEEQDEFANSGYGETLYMICSGIKMDNY